MTHKQLERANEIQSELRQVQEKLNLLDAATPYKSSRVNLVLSPGSSDYEIKGIDGRIVTDFIRSYSKELTDFKTRLISEFDNL